MIIGPELTMTTVDLTVTGQTSKPSDAAGVRKVAIKAIVSNLAAALEAGQRAALTIVEVDPAGDGFVFARVADPEAVDALTAQVSDLLVEADELHLTPRLIIASAGVSGHGSMDDRPDLLAVRDLIDGEGCTWLMVCSPDHVARDQGTFQRFLMLLMTRGVDLIFGRRSAWVNDGLD